MRGSLAGGKQPSAAWFLPSWRSFHRSMLGDQAGTAGCLSHSHAEALRGRFASLRTPSDASAKGRAPPLRSVALGDLSIGRSFEGVTQEEDQQGKPQFGPEGTRPSPDHRSEDRAPPSTVVNGGVRSIRSAVVGRSLTMSRRRRLPSFPGPVVPGSNLRGRISRRVPARGVRVILLGSSASRCRHRGDGGVPGACATGGLRSSWFFPQSTGLVRRCLAFSRWATCLGAGVVSALSTGDDVARALGAQARGHYDAPRFDRKNAVGAETVAETSMIAHHTVARCSQPHGVATQDSEDFIGESRRRHRRPVVALRRPWGCPRQSWVAGDAEAVGPARGAGRAAVAVGGMQDVRADDHGSTNRPDTGTHQFPAPARPSRFDRRLLARS